MRSMREPMGPCRWAGTRQPGTWRAPRPAGQLLDERGCSFAASPGRAARPVHSQPTEIHGRRATAVGTYFFFKITLYENYFDNYTSGKLFLKMDP
jgi:hypothetical protein